MITFIINLIILLIIAWIIGEQRANCGKAIGFRSLALLMLGAYIFAYMSCDQYGIIDYHVIAQVVTGISFVGAGLIFKDKSVHNLTTAILVWTMASIGILIGLNKIKEAIISSIIIWIILSFKKKKYE